MSLLARACEGGNANSCYYASGFYISGLKKENKDNNETVEYDVPKDMKLAFKYASKGCNMGNVYCCVNLSQMYSKGEGIGKNEELAKKYKDLALEMQKEAQEIGKTLTFQEGLS